MPRPRYDPGIELALRELNRLPGVQTRASCQGKSKPGEKSTHADLAYVTFRDPVPLSVEAELASVLGDIARVDPVSVYSRWPERNAELCTRLAEAPRSFLDARRPERWREAALALPLILQSVESIMCKPAPDSLRWCVDCETVFSGSLDAHRGCRSLLLLEGGPEQRLRLFGRFLAADERPPDPRLRQREGDAAILERVERGDFGSRYRQAWREFVSRAAETALREDVRASVAAERSRGASVDYYFRRQKVIFTRREG